MFQIAKTPGTWVLSGGTNTGIMTHVGEALEGSTKACIGVASWGKIKNKEALEENKEKGKTFGGEFSYRVSSSLVQKGAYLDHNHTHFLLSDDGQTKKYGGEVQVLSELQKELVANSEL